MCRVATDEELVGRVRVRERDPGRGSGLDRSNFEHARSRCTAELVVAGRGAGFAAGDQADQLGLLVLRGTLIHRLQLAGRDTAELLGGATSTAALVVILVALLVMMSIGGCGGSDDPDRQRGGGDRQQVSTGRADGQVRAAWAQPRDERCPTALPPGRSAAKDVLQAVPREVRRAYRSIDRSRYRAWAVFALDYRVVAPGLRRSRYVRIAARACGRPTAIQSWVAILDFPAAPAASFGPAIAFFARTETGWRIWHKWYPNMRESGFPE